MHRSLSALFRILLGVLLLGACSLLVVPAASAASFRVKARSAQGDAVVFKVRTKPLARCTFFVARGTTVRVYVGVYAADKRGKVYVAASVGGSGRPRLVGSCSRAGRSKGKKPQSFEAPVGDQSGSGGPGFEAAILADGAGASLADVEGAIAWAMQQRGRTDYNWWCLKFVANAYNAGAAGYNDPKQMAATFGARGGDPIQAPRGALMIFAASAENGWHGHVGISLGDGQMIDAQKTVDVRAVAGSAYWRSRYVGWMPPAPAWPGRPSSAAPGFSPTPAPAPSGGQPAPQTYRYSVDYTCANGACGLRKRSAPNTGTAVLGVLADGTPIDIVCQTEGEAVTGRAGTTVVWDRLTDGSYISDYYTTTPGYLSWSSNIPRC